MVSSNASFCGGAGHKHTHGEWLFWLSCFGPCREILRNLHQATTTSLKKSVNKVKCTLVQALRLCTGRTAHRGSRGIALHFRDHGTRRGWGFSVKPRPLFTLGKDPLPIVQEAGWAPGPVWTGAENLAPHRDSIPGPSSPYPVAIPNILPVNKP